MAISSSQTKTFSQLPDQIKNWLASEVVTKKIIHLNETLGKEGEEIKILPRLILSLVLGQFPRTELQRKVEAELSIPAPRAKDIVREIQDGILKQIQGQLPNLVGVVSSTPTVEPPTPQMPRQETKSGAEQTSGTTTDGMKTVPQQSPPQPSSPQTTEAPSQKPFMLHEEKSAFTENTPRTQPSVSFNLKKLSPKNGQPVRPVSAKVEAPGEEKESSRIVHYNELRTKLEENK